jgi:hypothetical protein
MADVFISHVDEDDRTAADLTQGLERNGVTTWHRDGRPDRAFAGIDESKCVLVIVSPDALSSQQLTEQIVHAHRSGKPFLPVLVSLVHEDWTSRQPEWRTAMGAATSIEVPAGGVDAILPRVVEGVAVLTAPPARPAAQSGARAKMFRRWVVPGVLAAAAVAGLFVWLGSRSGDTATEPPTASESVIPGSSSSFSLGPLADSATTAVQSVAGPFRVIHASATTEVCSRTFEQECKTATSGQRFVVLDMAEWDGRNVTFTDDLIRDMGRSYVFAGSDRATFAASTQDDARSGSFRLVYEGLPTAAVTGDVRLAWPGSPTLRLHLTEG